MQPYDSKGKFVLKNKKKQEKKPFSLWKRAVHNLTARVARKIV